jgi:hypothetical protein
MRLATAEWSPLKEQLLFNTELAQIGDGLSRLGRGWSASNTQPRNLLPRATPVIHPS